jgi:general secretion pathway protein D
MRIGKNNSGVVASLVLVVGFMTLNVIAEQTQPEKIDEFEGPNGMGSESDNEVLPPRLENTEPRFPPIPQGDFDDFLENPPLRNAPMPGVQPSKPQGIPPGPPPWLRQNQKNDNPSSMKNANADDGDVFRVVPKNCIPAKGNFIWNFEEEELINILRQVSDLLCRNIVVNDTIGKGMKMTIIGKSPLASKDAWDVLMASLAAKGLTLIQQGSTWTLIRRNESKNYATPMYEKGMQAGNNEAIGTLFYKVQHASQDSLKNVARSLISKDGLVDSVGDQFIIVIDSNSSIRRLGNIFSQVDVEDAINKVHVISLHNAEAKTVERQLRELFEVTPGRQPRMRRWRGPNVEGKSILNVDKIIADDRTNKIFVVADNDSAEKLKEVVAMIDQPASEQGSKGIYVKKLRYADAKKIAETLSTVLQQGRSGRFSRRREETTPELFEGEVKITAHENTNTLVTVASVNDYRSLLATINQLDIRKEQVYVEAVILDVEVTDHSQFGINLFSGLNIPGLDQGIGLIANPGGGEIAKGLTSSLKDSGSAGADLQGVGSSMGALAVLGNFISGGVAGIVGPPIGSGSSIPSFGAVLQALSTDSKVDVLSTPYLLTTDNQEAVMKVGEKVPTIRGASAVAGGVGGGVNVPLQTITHENVNLTFKVTPHVGADNHVRLEIEQEVDEIGGEVVIYGQKHNRIRTKSAKTTLVLKDQQTGVIGGLIHHLSKNTDSKTPFLGDIPILGWLFKNRDKKNERRSLLLVLTPYVIRTDEDFKKIVEKKLKEREEFARLYYGGKIKNYNKYINYDKKAGPISSMLLSVDEEMSKVENGGHGDGAEVTITPKKNVSEVHSTPTHNNEKKDDNESIMFGPDGGI